MVTKGMERGDRKMLLLSVIHTTSKLPCVGRNGCPTCILNLTKIITRLIRHNYPITSNKKKSDGETMGRLMALIN